MSDKISFYCPSCGNYTFVTPVIEADGYFTIAADDTWLVHTCTACGTRWRVNVEFYEMDIKGVDDNG